MTGKNQLLIQDIFPFYRLFFRQWRVLAHKNAPRIPNGQPKGIVVGKVGRFHKDAEVEKPFVQLLDDIDMVSGIDIESDSGILPMKIIEGTTDAGKGARFPASDIDRSRKRFRHSEFPDFLIGLVIKLKDFPCAALQELFCLGQGKNAGHEQKDSFQAPVQEP